MATARRQLGYVSSLTTQTVNVQGYGVATGGSSSSITVGTQAYTLLTFTSDSTLTVTKAGLFDILLIGGGGGGGGATNNNGAGGGGGGGGILGLDETITVYLDANQTIDVGAGGNGSTSYSSAGFPSRIGNKHIVYGGGRGGSYAQSVSSSEPENGGIMFRVGGAGANQGGMANAAGYGNAHFANGESRISHGQVSNTYIGGNGTDNFTSANAAGGGGGGANGNGGNAAGTTGGTGGNGRDISGFITGAAYNACAGGGGGGATGGSAGTGGVAGTTSGAGNAGVNYGAGGGGTKGGNGGNGQAGVVYVRFKV